MVYGWRSRDPRAVIVVVAARIPDPGFDGPGHREDTVLGRSRGALTVRRHETMVFRISNSSNSVCARLLMRPNRQVRSEEPRADPPTMSLFP